MALIVVRTAERFDLNKVAELRAAAYGARGYCPRETGAKEQHLSAPSSSIVLVAEKNDEIVGTISVLSGKETPADKAFPEEMTGVRSESGRIISYGSFAVKTGMWEGSVGLALIREALSITDPAEVAAIITNPRHSLFYKALGFEKIVHCPGVPELLGAPADLMVSRGESFQDLLRRARTGIPLYERKRRGC